MIYLSDEQLRRLHEIELEMLIEIDRICRKNNIQYSLDGGTLLGAIRHNGFIPWDDDADVVMLRSEYIKFCDACERDLDRNRFFLQEFGTDKEYRWGYSKLRRNGTVFLREGQEHVKCNQSVFVDIFICDNVPDGSLARKFHWLKCFFIRKGLYSVVGRKKSECFLGRCCYSILSLLPRDCWVKKIYKIANKVNKSETELVGHMTYPYPKSCEYGMPKKCFDEYIEKDFEGYSFRIFKEYKEYLSLLYGDYMTLPPIEKRKCHPVSQLNLEIGE